MAENKPIEFSEPGKVTLYNTETGKSSTHFPVDAREILEQEGSVYTADKDAFEEARVTAAGKLDTEDMDELNDEAEETETNEAPSKKATPTKKGARKK